MQNWKLSVVHAFSHLVLLSVLCARYYHSQSIGQEIEIPVNWSTGPNHTVRARGYAYMAAEPVLKAALPQRPPWNEHKCRWHFLRAQISQAPLVAMTWIHLTTEATQIHQKQENNQGTRSPHPKLMPMSASLPWGLGSSGIPWRAPDAHPWVCSPRTLTPGYAFGRPGSNGTNTDCAAATFMALG